MDMHSIHTESFSAKTMSISQYLAHYQKDQIISLVGPMCSSAIDVEAVNEPVIYVDGGAQYRRSTKGLVVGDGDSTTTEMDIKLNPEKDLSDLAYVLSEIPLCYGKIDLIGFLGGRMDHSLFNFGEVNQFLLERNGRGMARFEGFVTAYSAGKWAFDHHGLFSLCVFSQGTIRLTGECRYQCDPAVSFQSVTSLGLSNAASGTIHIENDAPVFVFFPESEIL